MVTKYGYKYGYKIWLQNMVTKYGYKIWFKFNLLILVQT